MAALHTLLLHIALHMAASAAHGHMVAPRHYIYVTGHWHGGTGVVREAFRGHDDMGKVGVCRCPGPQGEATFCLTKRRFDFRNTSRMNQMTKKQFWWSLRRSCRLRGKRIVVLKSPQIGTKAALESSGAWRGEDPLDGYADEERWAHLLGARRVTAVIVLRHPYALRPYDPHHGCKDVGECLSLWANALLLQLEPFVRLRVRRIQLVRYEDFIDHSNVIARSIIQESLTDFTTPGKRFKTSKRSLRGSYKHGRRLNYHGTFDPASVFKKATQMAEGSKRLADVEQFNSFMRDYFNYDLLKPSDSVMSPFDVPKHQTISSEHTSKASPFSISMHTSSKPLSLNTFSHIINMLIQISGAPHVQGYHASIVDRLRS